jgi:hypothetical protein
MLASRKGWPDSHDDLIERSADIHWPYGFDPDAADQFAHNAIVIEPADSIWAKLIDAAGCAQ